MVHTQIMVKYQKVGQNWAKHRLDCNSEVMQIEIGSR